MWTTIQGEIRTEYGGVTLSSGVQTVVLGPFSLARYPHKSWHVYNPSPTLTISGLVIQVNPDHLGTETGVPPTNPYGSTSPPNAGLWHTYDATTFQNLGSGQVRSVQISNSTYRWWRLIGLADNNALPSVTVSGWMYARTI